MSRGAMLPGAIGVAAVLSLVACVPERGEPGPDGVPGTLGISHSAGGAATDCSPGALFCDGGSVWRCHRSGLDASLAADCATYGTATNPGVCTTDARCAPGDAVCCALQKPNCSWNLLAPTSSEGQLAGGTAAPLGYCMAPSPPAAASPPDACGVTPAPRASSYVYVTIPSTACQPTPTRIQIDLDRSLLAPAATAITLPNAAVWMYLTTPGFSRSCSTWTGTITWLSDVPSWRVKVNATCSDGTGRTLVGEFWGDV